ncbi:hypothetical protein VCR20J5_880004 [Vibrio crassostreae]|nr:hypothetical protein VCR20J5_880004 [Vibrio crassostreae]
MFLRVSVCGNPIDLSNTYLSRITSGSLLQDFEDDHAPRRQPFLLRE